MHRDLRSVEQVFKALADPTRIRIVGLLLGGEICVCHMHETLGIPQSKASRHLAYLRRAGLVEAEKRGLWVYYRLARQREHIAQTLLDAARHCIGHLSDVRRDGAKLEKHTGCCLPEPGSITLDCCASPAVPSPATADNAPR
jgi:ArsR family transcriptional regulator